MSRRQQKRQEVTRRLALLLERLFRLENTPVEPHEKPIVEVGILALRERIRELGRQIRAFCESEGPSKPERAATAGGGGGGHCGRATWGRFARPLPTF